MKPSRIAAEDVHAQIALLRGRGRLFNDSAPIWIARSPGRLDFFGGNVDYTGGLVLQYPLREGIFAAAQSSKETTIRVFNPTAERHGWRREIAIPLSALEDLNQITQACSNESGSRWGCYVLGAFLYLRKQHGAFRHHGARLYLQSDLPPNRGLGSSAALEIATLKAAAAVAGIRLEGVSLAEAGQWVENVVAHSACGIMDQAACVLGADGCLLPLLCQPCQPEPALALPSGLRIWGIDSLVSRATTSAAYEVARAAAFMGYRMLCAWESLPLAPATDSSIPRRTDPLWNGYLSNLHPSDLRAHYESRLPESMLGAEFLQCYGEHVDPFTHLEPDRCYPVRAAVRYASEEHLRVQNARALLSEPTLAQQKPLLQLLGELMEQSHQAYAECGLGSPACDLLVELARKHNLWGAKMTGGGGGGVVALVGTTFQENAVAAVAADYARCCGASPVIFAGSSNGADIAGISTWNSDAIPREAESGAGVR